MYIPDRSHIAVILCLLVATAIASCAPTGNPFLQTPSLPHPTGTPRPSPNPSHTVPPTASSSSTPAPVTVGSLPAGQYILVASWEAEGRVGLRILSPGGVDLGLVTTGPFESPALSADNAKLAFVSRRLSLEPLTEIAVLDLDTLETKIIPGTLHCSDPSWSPDSEWLAIACRDGEIHAVNTVTSENITLTSCHDDAGFSCYWPSWSPDGSAIAFYGGLEFSGRNSLRFLTTECIPSGGTCTISDTKNPAAGIPYGWSPDSQTLAITSRGGFIDLVNPTTFRVVAKPLGSDLVVTSMTWSPDGQSIALIAHAIGGDDYMWITEVQSDRTKQVLNYAIDPMAIIAWLALP
jgi:Tol biopolymer transport system component